MTLTETYAINDTTNGTRSIIAGLSDIGTELGDFLTNIAPGLFKFLIYMTIAAGIGLVLYGIFTVINRKVKLR